MIAYVDEKGRKHYAEQVFSEDGQGILYSTKNESLLIRDSTGKEDSLYNYDEIQLLPLTEVDNVILPICRLTSCAGYILKIPKDFVPIKSIINTAEKDKQAFYIRTGDLRRRFKLLVNLARSFLQLHSLPVMYGGISANRILISNSSDNSEVYLMYSGEMSYTMNFNQYDNTDEYMAPETAEGRGGNILSDYYAFAALAYDVLTMEGSFTSLSEDIQALFEMALDKPEDQLSRPKILDFYNAFLKALDLLVLCKKCNRNIFFGEGSCKLCGAPVGKLLRATIYDKISKTVINKRMKIFEFTTNRQYFYNYHTDNILLSDEHKVALEFLLNISPNKKLHIILKNLMSRDIDINGNSVASGKAHAVELPCSVIRISYQLYKATTRFIDIEIHE